VTAAQVEADFRSLFEAVTTNLLAPFLVMQPRTAIWLSTLRVSGSRLFPNLTATGGEVWGVPVLVTRSSPLDANSPPRGMVALIDASEVLLADDGAVEFDASEQATIEMNDNPDDPVGTSSLLTSLWAHGLVGIKATRYVNWAPRRPGAVAYVTGLPA